MTCVLLMVALKKNDPEEWYVSVNFDTGKEPLPRNNSRDIMRCVAICNSYDDEYKYIDMFGLVHGEVQYMWEET